MTRNLQGEDATDNCRSLEAVRWLTASNRALGGEIPITLLDTSAGAHEVETVLDRIEFGVYS